MGIANVSTGTRKGPKVAKAATSVKAAAKGKEAAKVAKSPITNAKAAAKAVKSVPDKQTSKQKAAAAAAAAAAEATKQRHYGLVAEKAAALLKAAKAEKTCPALFAYREGTSYATVVAALHDFGIGKMVSADKLPDLYVKAADKAALKTFKTREPRNENGLDDWKAKVIQNAGVVCRPDYGKRLRDVGYEVRRERSADGSVSFGLFKYSA